MLLHNKVLEKQFSNCGALGGGRTRKNNAIRRTLLGWLRPQTTVGSPMSQPGQISLFKAFAHERLTHVPPVLAFTLGGSTAYRLSKAIDPKCWPLSSESQLWIILPTAYLLGAWAVDSPQNSGQGSSDLSVCAGSWNQRQWLPPHSGSRCHMWRLCDVCAAGLRRWGNSLSSRYFSTKPCVWGGGLSQNLQLNQAHMSSWTCVSTFYCSTGVLLFLWSLCLSVLWNQK